ncbi:unnamed protein product [Notodromas monacha]|uniref:Uncharacterized protein n=1 Tax=Notodromas monacha TaxID=399045 RepID=A0A7R9BH68_9CRUS|nr:unnamed protein product [Notodromas monacha]CAG0915421.1 unnamed protein product [Notodromas monacha]
MRRNPLVSQESLARSTTTSSSEI